MKTGIKTITILALLLALGFASCVPQKKMLYLKEAQMASENISKEYVNDRNIDYKLQPGDNLYIRFINTIDERGSAALTGDYSTSNRNYMSSDASIYLQSYTLDEEGCIELPLTGKIELKNLTVDQAKDKLKAAVKSVVSSVKVSSLTISRPSSLPVFTKVSRIPVEYTSALL